MDKKAKYYNGICIFDYHKTLAFSQKAHNLAYQNTVNEVYGVKGSLNEVNSVASTIQTVTKDIARLRGVSEKELALKESQILSVYEKNLMISLEKYLPRINSQVENFLDILLKNKFALSLYSGESLISLKYILKKINLDKYFPDYAITPASRITNSIINRKVLLKEAVTNAKKQFKYNSQRAIFVFDDSKEGIIAANELGLISIGITKDKKVISESNPQLIYPDFTSFEKIIGDMYKRLDKLKSN